MDAPPTGILVLLGALAGAAVFWCGTQFGAEAANEPTPGTTLLEHPNEPRLAELEERIERLRAEVATLRTDSARHAAPVELDGTATPGAPDRRSKIGNLGPRHYLNLYVRSFETDPNGSKYFQLAVDAWAMELASELSRLVRDASQPLALRRQLVAMLTNARFHGHTIASSGLLALIRVGPDSLAILAANGLGQIGTKADVGQLVDLFPGLSPSVQIAVLDALGKLSGPDAGHTFLRLLRAANDSTTRKTIIQRFPNTDPPTSLQILRDASRSELTERAVGAQRLAGLYGPRFSAFAEEWIGFETNPRVRQLLAHAKTKLTQLPYHHPMQATGAPNADPNKDDQKAWATAQADAGVEWLEVEFNRPMRATSIRIHEVCVAGAVTEVITIATDGRRHTVWKGQDPTRTPGVFVVPMEPTAYRVRGVRVIVDTRRQRGWNEIDTVQLVGPGGAQWAAHATASSHFGANRSSTPRRFSLRRK